MNKPALFVVMGMIALPLVLLLFSLHAAMFNEQFYHEQFEKNKAYEKYGKDTVNEVNTQILQFYKHNTPLISDFFNDKERSHLADVRNLYIFSKVVLYLSLVIFLISLSRVKEKTYRAKILTGGALLTLSIVLFVALFATTNFTSSFTAFHKLVFTNENWMLNPATDNIILLFPESFFIAFVLLVLKNTTIMALLCLMISAAIKKEKVC